MLVAKINPSATFSQKDENPFSAPTIVSYEYIGVISLNYIPGANNYEFLVLYGNLVDLNDKVYLKRALEKTQLSLDTNELANWGTDDEELFQIIANKLGTTILEFKDVDNNLNIQ